MHERIQRQICRAVFLAGCLVPTLATLGYCLWHHRPGRVARWEQTLSDHVGLEVTLQDVVCPRPGVTRYLGVKLNEPETGRLLAQIDALQVVDGGELVSLTASSMRIAEDGLADLWQCLRQRMHSTRPVTLVASSTELAWQQGDQSHLFRALQLRIEPTQAGTQAVLVFSPAEEAKQPSAARLRIVRNRQTVPPSTAWELETGPTPLPCRLLAAVQPDAARLGPDSQFRGAVWVAEGPDGCDGELSGELIDVDLAGLLQGHPHRLSGTAHVGISLARFHNSRLEELTASLTAGPGQIGPSLLAACVEHLGLVGDVPDATLRAAEPYEQLGIKVWLNGKGTVLEGNCPGGDPKAVLVGRWGKLSTPSTSIARPIASLVQLLAPGSASLVPLSREAQGLSRILPLPTRAE